MAERSLKGCNEILEDNPPRWLVTISLVPSNPAFGLLTETRIIETEPSLWWKSEKWQEFQEMTIPVEQEDGTTEQEVQEVPVYKMCVMLMVAFIGGGA